MDDDFVASPLEERMATPSNDEDVKQISLEEFREAASVEPSKRGLKQISTISEGLAAVKTFAKLNSEHRSELAFNIRLVDYPEPDFVVFHQGDDVVGWYVVYEGSVGVYVNGEQVATREKGDEINLEVVLRGCLQTNTVKTASPNTMVLVIGLNDFHTSLLNLFFQQVITVEEKGKVVAVFDCGDKANLSDPDSIHYNIAAGTPEKLIQYLPDLLDIEFVEDFLMSFRVFSSPMDLWGALMDRFAFEKTIPHAADGRLRVIATICKWIEQYPLDFKTNESLLDQSRQFLDLLLNEKEDDYYNQVLNSMNKKSFNTKGRRLKYDAEKRNSIMVGSSGGGSDKNSTAGKSSTLSKMFESMTLKKKKGETTGRKKSVDSSSNSEDSFKLTSHESQTSLITIEPYDPVPEEVEIFRTNGTSVKISVTVFMTSADIIAATLEADPSSTEGNDISDYVLCEVKSNKEKVEYENWVNCIRSRMTPNGRLYLKGIKLQDVAPWTAEQFAPVDLRHLSAKFESRFLDLDVEEVARLMTLYDHNLFRRVDPLEYVHHIYKTKNRNVSNLNVFAYRFVEVGQWVATETCRESNISKRAQILKKFIDIASVCMGIKNFNSCFSILSGLSDVAVSRLQATWKKLPSKIVQEYEELQKHMDPSRNMKNYRTLLETSSLPLLPFFPLLIKDLFFVNDCNESFVRDGLVNFEKLRLLASIVRKVDVDRYSQFDHLAEPYSIPMKEGMEKPEKKVSPDKTFQYITHLFVIDDTKLLMEMSRELEPPSN